MVLNGYLQKNFVFEENQDSLYAIVNNPSSYAPHELSHARERLALLQEFDPSKPHERLTAHRVHIFQTGSKHLYIRDAKQIVKSEEPLFTFDFGDELMKKVDSDDSPHLSQPKGAHTYFDIIYHIGSNHFSYEHHFNRRGFKDFGAFLHITSYEKIDSCMIRESSSYLIPRDKGTSSSKRLLLSQSRAKRRFLLSL